ncbi:MAG: hypothetical protein R3C15_09935 [Thermoleophilia bacterium]
MTRPTSMSTAPPATRSRTARRLAGVSLAVALTASGAAHGAGPDALWPTYSADPAENQRLAPREDEPAQDTAPPAPTVGPFVEEDSPGPRAVPLLERLDRAPTPAPAPAEPVGPAREPAARTTTAASTTSQAGTGAGAVQPVADLVPATGSDGGRSIVLAALLALSALLLAVSSLPPWLVRDVRVADVLLRYRIEAAALGGLGLLFTAALWILL